MTSLHDTTPLWKINPAVALGSPFEPGARHDVVVVGAGLTGLSTALMLARAGKDVAVVEQGGIAELSSGGNTGKMTLLQSDQPAQIRRSHSASLVRAYIDANRDGMNWMLETMDAAGVGYTRRTDHTYAQTASGMDAIRAQHDTAREAGLPTRMLDASELADQPFPAIGAVALDDQVAIDPVLMAQGLAREFVAAGGKLHEGVRVTGAQSSGDVHVETEHGPLFAEHIVLATGTPILDRGLYFSKVRGMRSYCVSFRTAGPVPEGMFIASDSPDRSIRPVSAADGPADAAQLVIGGNGHPVGRGGDEAAKIDDLIDWTRQHFPDAEPVHRWSAQDYVSHNLVPFVGALPRGGGHVWLATGYAKWGLTNAPAAALRLTDEILGTPREQRKEWMTTIGTRITVPSDIARGATESGKVAASMAAGWVQAEARRTPVPQPAEGEGVVANRGGRPVGVSTVDGETRAVSAVCTHLGGVLEWNEAECSWDCPLHASRFGADGTRIEGPAVKDLERMPRTPES